MRGERQYRRHRVWRRQYGQPITFREFARYGVPVAVGSVLICLPYVLLRYS